MGLFSPLNRSMVIKRSWGSVSTSHELGRAFTTHWVYHVIAYNHFPYFLGPLNPIFRGYPIQMAVDSPGTMFHWATVLVKPHLRIVPPVTCSSLDQFLQCFHACHVPHFLPLLDPRFLGHIPHVLGEWELDLLKDGAIISSKPCAGATCPTFEHAIAIPIFQNLILFQIVR